MALSNAGVSTAKASLETVPRSLNIKRSMFLELPRQPKWSLARHLLVRYLLTKRLNVGAATLAVNLVMVIIRIPLLPLPFHRFQQLKILLLRSQQPVRFSRGVQLNVGEVVLMVSSETVSMPTPMFLSRLRELLTLLP